MPREEDEDLLGYVQRRGAEDLAQSGTGKKTTSLPGIHRSP